MRCLAALSIALAACCPCPPPAPAVDAGAAPFACLADPVSPCPPGCGCREHDRVCVPTPQRPEADCRTQ